CFRGALGRPASSLVGKPSRSAGPPATLPAMSLRWLRLQAVAFALCVASPQPLPADPRPIRLLMVGNSLTEANDLPAMVATLAHLAGDDPPIEVAAVVIGGSSLQDQLDAGAAAF